MVTPTRIPRLNTVGTQMKAYIGIYQIIGIIQVLEQVVRQEKLNMNITGRDITTNRGIFL